LPTLCVDLVDLDAGILFDEFPKMIPRCIAESDVPLIQVDVIERLDWFLFRAQADRIKLSGLERKP
jgi:hypothetical protein